MSMMDIKGRTPNFELFPTYEMKGINSFNNSQILDEIKSIISKNKKTILVFDYYYGVNEKNIYENFISKLNAELLIDTSKEIKYSEEVIQEKFHCFITDDRENGVFCTCHIEDFFDENKKSEALTKIDNAKDLVIVYGVGAASIVKPDVLVYCSIDFEEKNHRFENGLNNWGANNYDEDSLKKMKRDKFLEERVQFWHKLKVMENIDFFMDCTIDNEFVMLRGDDYREVMDRFTKRPFKLVPFFRPGVWGGHWCQKVLGAGKDLKNTAWGITGMVDMQSVRAKCGENVVTIPGKFIEFYRPIELLGPLVYFFWGYWNPTTLDFLDTMGGQNLSLQCHPTNAYGNENFNYQFGHFESYYILDTTDHSSVYLGTKTGVKKEELFDKFAEAQKTGTFDDEKYINNIPMKTHDHIFIPSGTIHASAADTLVLEINSTWVSTFKLWDWGRLGLDGKPRPINIEHGKNVFQEKYQTDFVMDRLVSKKSLVDRGDGWKKEHSGTMPYEPLTVDRYWVKEQVCLETNEHIKTLCLVDGEEAVIESPTGAFDPISMHYAEAVIVPARVGKFMVRPCGRSEGREIAFLECYQNLGSNN